MPWPPCRAVYRVKRQTDGRIYAMKQINTQKMTQKEREDAVNEVGAASRPTCAPPVFGGGT